MTVFKVYNSLFYPTTKVGAAPSVLGHVLMGSGVWSADTSAAVMLVPRVRLPPGPVSVLPAGMVNTAPKVHEFFTCIPVVICLVDALIR